MEDAMTTDGNKPIPIPEWIVPRDENWRYVGWIGRNPFRVTFEELCERAVKSDHGEVRELDFYQEGAVTWVKE